jgi:hypothetical protein
LQDAARALELVGDRDDAPAARLLLHRVDEVRVEHVNLVDAAVHVLVDQNLDRADQLVEARPVAELDTLDTTLAPRRFRNPRPLVPMATTSTSRPAARHSLLLLHDQAQHIGVEAAAQALVRRHDDGADALHGALHQERVLVLDVRLGDVQRDGERALEYGRDARMRSCALRIFDAATISIALVILRVDATLLILLRISFEPAIVSFRCRLRESTGSAAISEAHRPK